MTSTKEISNEKPVGLHDDPGEDRGCRCNRTFLINYFRRKLNIGTDETERTRQGIMNKDGHYKIRYDGLSLCRREYLHDLYISLIDLKWRYALAMFFTLYLLSFLLFALIWWIIAYSHGDFQNVNTPNWEPCATNMYNFKSCLLLSIELQTTIGYGAAYPNTDCNGTLFTLYLQVTVGMFLDSLMLGFIFVKFSQPKKRQNTILFSKNACVTNNGGELSLQVRVGDMRKSHLLAAQVTSALVRSRTTEEGVCIPLYFNNVDFRADGMDDTIVLLWPVILKHKITKDSPFWDIKPTNVANDIYELILFIEGTIETTGEVCQVRTSYTPREFLWGYRFDGIEHYNNEDGRWEIDFSRFNAVVNTSKLKHSAKELANLKMNKNMPFTNDDVDFNRKLPNENKETKFASDNVPPALPSNNGEKGITFDSLQSVDSLTDAENLATEHTLRKDCDVLLPTTNNEFSTKDDVEEKINLCEHCT